MPTFAQSRPCSLTLPGNQVFTLSDVRLLACDPVLLPACAAYARRFYPRAGSLARAA